MSEIKKFNVYDNKMVDIPHGDKYGFPKKYHGDGENLFQWIVEQGYPEELMEAQDFEVKLYDEPLMFSTTVEIKSA